MIQFRFATRHSGTFPEYERAVSEIMRRRYGITWVDACGDPEPLANALADGQTPEDFVRWWGERYDLVEVERFGI